MKTKISKIVTILSLIIGFNSFAQFNASNLIAAYPTTRAVTRPSNIVMAYGVGGNLIAVNAIGVKDGAYSLGTTNTNDTTSVFNVYGNLNALGGVAFQYEIDSSATPYKMQYYTKHLTVKGYASVDTVFLPSTASLKAFYGSNSAATNTTTVTSFPVFTIKNALAIPIYLKGSTRAEYIDTTTTYTLAARASISLIFTGLSAPTSTVVATNKINASFVKD